VCSFVRDRVAFVNDEGANNGVAGSRENRTQKSTLQIVVRRSLLPLIDASFKHAAK
jgi:hypothetical protein